MKKILLALLVFSVFPACVFPQGKLQFEQKNWDFGYIAETESPVTHRFVFRNASHKPVQIERVVASCGCTSPNWSRMAVMPGKEGFVSVSFDPHNRRGAFHKKLLIFSNIAPDTLFLQGEVIESRAKIPIADLVLFLAKKQKQPNAHQQSFEGFVKSVAQYLEHNPAVFLETEIGLAQGSQKQAPAEKTALKVRKKLKLAFAKKGLDEAKIHFAEPEIVFFPQGTQAEYVKIKKQ